ncbi:hypothetical protein HK405_010923, partial [Cladochytrium tenue]
CAFLIFGTSSFACAAAAAAAASANAAAGLHELPLRSPTRIRFAIDALPDDCHHDDADDDDDDAVPPDNPSSWLPPSPPLGRAYSGPADTRELSSSSYDDEALVDPPGPHGGPGGGGPVAGSRDADGLYVTRIEAARARWASPPRRTLGQAAQPMPAAPRMPAGGSRSERDDAAAVLPPPPGLDAQSVLLLQARNAELENLVRTLSARVEQLEARAATLEAAAAATTSTAARPSLGQTANLRTAPAPYGNLLDASFCAPPHGTDLLAFTDDEVVGGCAGAGAAGFEPFAMQTNPASPVPHAAAPSFLDGSAVDLEMQLALLRTSSPPPPPLPDGGDRRARVARSVSPEPSGDRAAAAAAAAVGDQRFRWTVDGPAAATRGGVRAGAMPVASRKDDYAALIENIGGRMQAMIALVRERHPAPVPTAAGRVRAAAGGAQR